MHAIGANDISAGEGLNKLHGDASISFFPIFLISTSFVLFTSAQFSFIFKSDFSHFFHIFDLA